MHNDFMNQKADLPSASLLPLQPLKAVWFT
jgi:hypothetical protein